MSTRELINKRNNNTEANNGLIIVDLRYCTVCNIEQPLRAKHCRICAKCVATYDHHCPWLGNCIGERNRKYFYIYLWSQLFQLIAGLVTAVLIIKESKERIAGGILIGFASLFVLFVIYLVIYIFIGSNIILRYCSMGFQQVLTLQPGSVYHGVK